MGAMKRFLEKMSATGEITGATIKTAQQVQKKLCTGKLKCTDHENEILTPATFAGLFDGDPVCKEAYKVREQFLDSVSGGY